MAETRAQRKDRLKRAGLWQAFVAERERLKVAGVPPRAARTQALREVESRAQQAQRAAVSASSAQVPGKRLLLCSRCAGNALLGRSVRHDCPTCKETTARGITNDFDYPPEAYLPPDLRVKQREMDRMMGRCQ
jgi:rubrerythrin